MRYGRTSGTRTPASGSGHSQQWPLPSLDDDACASARNPADYPFVPADRCFDQGAPIVAAVLLPTHAAVLRDLLKMPITLRRRDVRGLARHGGRAWQHDNRGLRMTFGNRIVDIVPVVRP